MQGIGLVGADANRSDIATALTNDRASAKRAGDLTMWMGKCEQCRLHCLESGHLPGQRGDAGSLYRWLNRQVRAVTALPQEERRLVEELLDEYAGVGSTKWRKMYEKCSAYCAEFGHLPVFHGDADALAQWLHGQLSVERGLPDDQMRLVQELVDQYPGSREHRWQCTLDRVADYFDRFGRLPPEEGAAEELGRWVREQRGRLDRYKASDHVRFERLSLLFSDARLEAVHEKMCARVGAYVEATGYLPHASDSDPSLYQWMLYILRGGSVHGEIEDRVSDFLVGHVDASNSEWLRTFQEFYDEMKANGLPSCETRLGRWWRAQCDHIGDLFLLKQDALGGFLMRELPSSMVQSVGDALRERRLARKRRSRMRTCSGWTHARMNICTHARMHA